ncbi:hypothetical protein Tco_1375828 [Tanacetum coccineum]
MNEIQEFNATKWYKASRGTLSKKRLTRTTTIHFQSKKKCPQPANMIYSQHLRKISIIYHKDASDNGTAINKPKQQQQQQLIPTTTIISNIKLPILKKEEYDIWAMDMEHYQLNIIDNDVWKDLAEHKIHAVEKEMNFIGMDDAKEIWEAIRTRFGGNVNSKKMQKVILKQQFKAFTILTSEGLEKGYDRFQQLLSQLEAHGAEVLLRIANHKLSSQICNPLVVKLAMTMRNQTRFAYSTYTPSTSSNNIPEREVPAGFANEVIYLLFAKQSEDLDLLHEDLEQIDDMDIEEMDINWQIAMIAIRMKKECPSKGTNDGKKRDSFYQGAGKKEQNQNCLLIMDNGTYKKLEISDLDDTSNEHSTCQSNYSEGSFGNPSEHSSESESESISVPNEMSTSKSVTINEKAMSESKEVKPSCVTHVKTPRQPMKNKRTPKVKGKNWNEMMVKRTRRSKLQLADASGISMLPNTEIFEGMGNMGYPADGTFTFWKSHFTPQWRFLVHHILHCMSPKSGGCDQFRRNLTTALICLSTGRIYNFSKLIFDGMVANLKSKTKFLMYPRFLQMILEIQTENKHPYLAIVLTKKIFGNMKRGFRGVPRPLLPAMLPVVAVDQSAGQADQAVDQPSPSEPLPSSSHPPVLSATTESEPTPVAEQITHPTSLTPEPDSEPIEHTFEQPSPEHQPLSPRQETEVPQSQDPTHPHVAEERTMTVDDLLQLVPKLITKVDSLETELKQTKLTMGKALVKLVKKVKKMEDVLKRRHVVLPDSEDEDAEISSKQGRNLQEEGLDEMVRNMMKDKSEVFKTPTQGKTSGEEDISPTTLEAAKTLSKVASQRSKSVDKGKRYKRRKESKGKDIDTGFEDISTGFEEVNTGGLGVSTGSGPVSSARGQREGKAPMIVEETQAPKRTKEQIQQEEASLAEAIRLQTLEEEETAKQVHLDALLAKRLAEEEELTEQQKQRKAQVQFEAQHYTEEDWDAIRAKLEANAELTKNVLGKELPEEDFAKKMVELVNQRKKFFAEERAKARRSKPMTQSLLRNYMMNYLKNQGTWKLTQLKKLSFEEVKEEFDKLVKQVESFVPILLKATNGKLKDNGEDLQTKFQRNKGL